MVLNKHLAYDNVFGNKIHRATPSYVGAMRSGPLVVYQYLSGNPNNEDTGMIPYHYGLHHTETPAGDLRPLFECNIQISYKRKNR